ncbi:TetR family transcriptional regulator [Corynebacterium mayonis]|uniref:TetR family transcriptional regulator n=1 Tax=Corynebacterium mayonis TaxID=3062461 RepID=UPI0031400A01
MQLSRDAISTVALKLLNSYGLADVSMRRIATTLGVAPGALYWHIKNKQELISDLALHIIAPVSANPPSTPEQACASLRAAMLNHRDGAEVVLTAISQPDSVAAEQLFSVMHQALDAAQGEGASTHEKTAAAEGLIYLTLGAAYAHQSALQLEAATGEAPKPSLTRPGSAEGVERAVGFLLKGLGSE